MPLVSLQHGSMGRDVEGVRPGHTLHLRPGTYVEVSEAELTKLRAHNPVGSQLLLAKQEAPARAIAPPRAPPPAPAPAREEPKPPAPAKKKPNAAGQPG